MTHDDVIFLPSRQSSGYVTAAYIATVLPDTSTPATYELSAVLIHRGPSAYSGHYIAHVRDRSAGVWRRLNDEESSILGSSREVGTEVRA